MQPRSGDGAAAVRALRRRPGPTLLAPVRRSPASYSSPRLPRDDERRADRGRRSRARSQRQRGGSSRRSAPRATKRDRRGAAEGAGDGVEGAQAEPALAGDGVDRLPGVGDELGLERLQPLEVVEQPAPGAEAVEEQADEPGGWVPEGSERRESGASPRVRKRASDAASSRAAAWSRSSVAPLGAGGLPQPRTICSISQPRAGGHRRGDQEGHRLAVTLGDEDAAVFEPGQGLGLDQEVHRRQAAGGEPLFEAAAEARVAGRPLRRPAAGAHPLVAGAVDLGAERRLAVEGGDQRLRASTGAGRRAPGGRTARGRGAPRPGALRRRSSSTRRRRAEGVRLEGIDHCSQPLRRADRLAPATTRTPAAGHVAHHRVPLGGEPAPEARVEDLVAGGVSPVCQHQRARPGEVLALGQGRGVPRRAAAARHVAEGGSHAGSDA